MKLSILAGALLLIAHTATAGAADAASPYVGQQDRAIKALSDADIRDLQDGRGLGLAKAAELNSYPGPLHVLQLKDALGLSDQQRAATEAVFATMQTRAQALGARIIEAERGLDRAFIGGTIDRTTLRTAVAGLAALQGELRAVHLEAHLAQRSLLTADQVARYDALRGYAAAAPAPAHQHSHP
jgi:hypothetical protein